MLIKNWIDEKQKKGTESKNITEWWKAMSWFRRNKNTRSNDIPKEEWLNHFMNLLEGEPPKNAQENNEQKRGPPEAPKEGTQENEGTAEEREAEQPLNAPLTDLEISKAINNSKNGKAAGEDEIAAEFIKEIPEQGTREVIEIVKAIWKEEKIIERWRTAMIFPIHKRGSEEEAKNYRGVSLLDLGYKILATTMARRLADWLEAEEKLTEAQAGFRPGRSTMEQVFVLNTLVGNRLKEGKKLYTAFIDFKAAFDKVDRSRLWQKMEDKGIKGKFMRVTKDIYRCTWNTVITGEDVASRFDTKLGVRQGCPLSPIFFNIYIDDLETELRRKGNGGTRIGPGTKDKIYALLYADDAALLAEDAEGLNRILKSLAKWADDNQMEVSIEKTKVMVFRNGGRRKKEDWFYKGEQLEVVNEFKYLGFWFTTRNQYNTHTRKTAGKTQRMINKVWGETRRASVTELRRRLFFMEATSRAAALYGAELWGWAKRTPIERVQSRYVKASLGVAKNTPYYIWKMEAGRTSITAEARRAAGRFLARISEMKDTRWAKKCLREQLRGIKNQNATSWGEELEKALKEAGDGELVNWLYQGHPTEEIREKLDNLNTIMEDQDTQNCWGKIEQSSYCEYYKELKENIEMERYWKRKDLTARQKETWARWRCGNVVKENKRGYTENNCRACKKEKETLEHVVSCQVVLRALKADERSWWQNWRPQEDGEIRQKLIRALKGNIDRRLCRRLMAIERALRKHDEPDRKTTDGAKAARKHRN